MSLVVRIPNNDRVSVKITPHTTVQEVVKEVCSGRGLSEQDFSLGYGGKPLDETLKLHYCDFEDCSELQLISCSKTTYPITISLQCDFLRFTGTFRPEDSLWEVVLSLCPDNLMQKSVPGVVHIQEKIVGKENLQNKTLEHIGIKSGKAIIRLVAEPISSGKKSAKFCNSSATSVERGVHKSVLKSTRGEAAQSKPKEVHFNQGIEEKPFEGDEQDITYIDLQRRALLLTVPEGGIPAEDLTDDFFEHTSDEMRSIYKDLKQERHLLENRPLQLKSSLAQLQAEHKTKMSLKYKFTVIRIHFPDLYIVQAVFKSIERVQDVVEFIKDQLKYPNIKFNLYSAPPKNVLKAQDRLIDIKCIPSARLYFGVLNVEDFPDNHYIREDLKEKLSPYSTAVRVAGIVKHTNFNEYLNSIAVEKMEVNLHPENRGSDPCISTSGHSLAQETPDSTPKVAIRSERLTSDQQNTKPKAPKWFRQM